MSERDQAPRWVRVNWGVPVVALLAVNMVLDLVLGRHGVTGTELGLLVLLWLSWWVLVAITVAAAVTKVRQRR